MTHVEYARSSYERSREKGKEKSAGIVSKLESTRSFGGSFTFGAWEQDEFFFQRDLKKKDEKIKKGGRDRIGRRERCKM